MNDLLLFADFRKTFKVSHHQMYDNEYIGTAFIALSCNYTSQGDYSRAYDFMRYGMTLATCDCKVMTIFNKVFSQSILEVSVEYGEINDGEEYKGYFLQAAVGILMKKDENIDQLMFCIDEYLRFRKDDVLGLAIKGRLYGALGNYQNATLYLERSLDKRKLTSTLYRLSRFKQLDDKHHKPLDVKYMLEAYLINPYCGCVLSHLTDCLKRYSIKAYEDSELDLSFVSEIEHDSIYYQFLCSFMDQPIEYNTGEINKFDFIHGYARTMGDNYNRIIKEATKKSDILIQERLLTTDKEDGGEERNNSNASYDKYNGAYGYNDDTIDSAFEGDPENYWNID